MFNRLPSNIMLKTLSKSNYDVTVEPHMFPFLLPFFYFVCILMSIFGNEDGLENAETKMLNIAQKTTKNKTKRR